VEVTFGRAEPAALDFCNWLACVRLLVFFEEESARAWLGNSATQAAETIVAKILRVMCPRFAPDLVTVTDPVRF